jgi:hypothetical protein
MEFCPNYGSTLKHKTVWSGNQAMLTVLCQKYGYKNKDTNVAEKVDLKVISHTAKQMAAIIEKIKT